jgi:hypothetical protein
MMLISMAVNRNTTTDCSESYDVNEPSVVEIFRGPCACKCLCPTPNDLLGGERYMTFWQSFTTHTYIYIYIYIYTLQIDLLLVQIICNRIYFFLLQVSSELVLQTVGNGDNLRVS